jgi:hypothetical protein
MERRVGTAGWTLPSNVRDRFRDEGTQLERSSFYGPHRRTTYARWAAGVPDDFRFAPKMPKEITHARRLVDVDEALTQFLDASSGLGRKRDVLLVTARRTSTIRITLVRGSMRSLVRCALRRRRRGAFSTTRHEALQQPMRWLCWRLYDANTRY